MNGILQSYITLFPGCTYEFNQDDSSNSGHPLRFATQADAANSSEYTTGVTTSGTPGWYLQYISNVVDLATD